MCDIGRMYRTLTQDRGTGLAKLDRTYIRRMHDMDSTKPTFRQDSSWMHLDVSAGRTRSASHSWDKQKKNIYSILNQKLRTWKQTIGGMEYTVLSSSKNNSTWICDTSRLYWDGIPNGFLVEVYGHQLESFQTRILVWFSGFSVFFVMIIKTREE